MDHTTGARHSDCWPPSPASDYRLLDTTLTGLWARGAGALADVIEDGAPPELYDGDPRDTAVFALPPAMAPVVEREMAAARAERRGGDGDRLAA